MTGPVGGDAEESVRITSVPDGRDLIDAARQLRADGHPVEAAEAAGRATAVLRDQGDELGAARAQRLAADALADADHHEDALALLKRARRVFVGDDPSGPDAAGAEAAAARSLRALGHTEESRRALHRAERGYAASGMPVRAAMCVLDRAVLHHDDGDVADSIELLDAARTTFLDHRRPDLAAVGDFDLGVALLDGDRADDAIERFLGARGIFTSLGRRGDEASCDLNLGVALHAVGRSDEARLALRRARTVFRDLGRDRDAEQAEHDLDVLDGLVDPDTAELSVLRDLGEVPPELVTMAAQLDPPTDPSGVPAVPPEAAMDAALDPELTVDLDPEHTVDLGAPPPPPPPPDAAV
ncbi:MAG TPA: tetratricopeptide repeat protein [Iamia sp.]